MDRKITEEQKKLIEEFAKTEGGVEHPKALTMKSVIGRIREFLNKRK